MEREDLPNLCALGFEDEELLELGLWEPVTGNPADLAEMYVRRSKKKDTLSALREQVRRMCWHARQEEKRIRHVWFEQKSASKAHVKREEFDKATAAIADARLSKTLYVFKTSRLSRRGMGQVGLLLDRFEERQARIYVVAENIDSTRSRMVLAILSEQAREQASDISEFTKIGIDGNKADGRWTGGVTPYGLHSPPKSGKLAHNPAEYPTARRIAEWRRVVPILEVSAGIGEVDFSTVRDMCLCVARIDQCERDLSQRGLMVTAERGTVKNGAATIAGQYRSQLSRYICELGLSPSARTSITVREPADSDDVWD